MNPLDWTAGPFLLLDTGFAAGVLLWLAVRRHRVGARAAARAPGGLDALHLAYLAGGASRAAGAALVGLLEAGAAVADRKRRLVRFDASVPVAAELQPFRHVYQGEADRSGFEAQFSARWQRLHDDLAWRGLLPGPAETERFQRQGMVLLGVPLLLGGCKVAVGLHRERPADMLCLLLILTGVLGAVLLLRRPHRNLTGAAALADARRQHARAARAPLPEEMALAFALSGAAVLAGRDYRWAVLGSNSSSNEGGCGSDGGGGGCGGCSG